ncbi:MAG TPA: DUF86 domain-containing protein [Oscillatoriaceae cyanobacterium M33_DOE_052]|uniref:DUF86 domain-containing protein n=1 Tax=Planktothricoides sp. SpSt-374 TaxID=2282167 RepID=A0A7C3VR13_9CYAN|nr:DUF86 domain-containing protein [Oscillatoriaceae cyanobacterium M33_DOE_052]
MRRTPERLQDILDAIEAIQRYTHQGKSAFENQELIQVWVLHHLAIIGEAVNALPAELLEKKPEMPWAQIIGLRNRLIHEYFRIDPEIIWSIATEDLPPLQIVISRMLVEIDSRLS